MKLFVKVMLIPIGLLLAYLAILFYNQFTYLHGATTGEMIDAKKLTNRALLVIDVQNIFYPRPDDNLRSKNFAAFNLLSNVNTAIDHFEGLRNEIIFITQVKEKKTIRSFFMPHVPARGTKEAEINSGLRVSNPIMFTKLRADAFSNPDLQRYLNQKNIGTLYIAGMAAEVCVDYTIQGAINRGYQVYVIRDAIFAVFGEKSKEKRLQKYAKLGAKIISIEDFKSLKLK